MIVVLRARIGNGMLILIAWTDNYVADRIVALVILIKVSVDSWVVIDWVGYWLWR